MSIYDEVNLRDIDQIRYLFANEILDKNKKTRRCSKLKELQKILDKMTEEKYAQRYINSPKYWVKYMGEYVLCAATRIETTHACVEIKAKKDTTYNNMINASFCVELHNLFTEKPSE